MPDQTPLEKWLLKEVGVTASAEEMNRIEHQARLNERKKIIEEIMQIELAPDTITINKVMNCSGKTEAFGYGQGWILKKIEELNQ